METDNKAKRAQLTQAELTQLLAGMDANGVLITLAPAANAIIERLYQRLTSTRKPRVNLRDPATLSYYQGLAIGILKANREQVLLGGSLIGESAVSIAIGLDGSTMGKNKTLHALYEAHRASVCNIRPVTVNNDYD